MRVAGQRGRRDEAYVARRPPLGRGDQQVLGPVPVGEEGVVRARRRLYASLGFTVEGVLPGEFVLGGEPVDDVLMGLRLD
jgi:hypothetical protein